MNSVSILEATKEERLLSRLGGQLYHRGKSPSLRVSDPITNYKLDGEEKTTTDRNVSLSEDTADSGMPGAFP